MKNDDVHRVQSWNVFSGNVSLLFTLIAIHFIDNIWVLLITAFVLDFILSALRHLFFFSCVLIGRLLDHRKVFVVWTIGTLIYFFIKGNWLLGMYALLYSYVIGPIFQLPGV